MAGFSAIKLLTGDLLNLGNCACFFFYRELLPSSFAMRTFANDGSEIIQEVTILKCTI